MTSLREVLEEWYQRVVRSKRAHYLSADRCAAKKYWLGVPAVLLSTLVGTSVFATLQEKPEFWLQVSIGLTSVAAALLTSLQTFLGYAERAEKHRMAAAKYGALARELEELRAQGTELAPETISQLRKKLDELAIESPDTPASIYRLVRAAEGK